MKKENEYRIWAPVMNRTLARAGREQILQQLQAMEAIGVILAVQPYSMQDSHREAELAALRENCRFFRAHGLAVGAWTWAFMVEGEHSMTCMRAVSGAEIATEVCPLDDAFRVRAGEWIKALASCGVELLLYDDDFRFGFHEGGVCCICKHHLQKMSAMVGEELCAEDMPRLLLSGGKNKYRDAWLAVNGKALESFAAEMRAAVDTVSPSIRLGICSCMSSWDMDGTTAVSLARILAGKTKPFLRLSGAPYWAVRTSFGQRLQDVIEFERMLAAWTQGEGIEVLSECDSYPRPCWICPSSYLELFDLAMRADGKCCGTLKYVFDYRMNAEYESGYVRHHLRNVESARKLEALFADKEDFGVRVWEAKQKFADTVVPACMEGKDRVQYQVFSPASQMLAALSVPTTHTGIGEGNIAFGENVRYIPREALAGGLITDARGAEILSEMGVDVGVRAWNGTCKTEWEYFCDAVDFTSTDGAEGRLVTLDRNALVQSCFVGRQEQELIFLGREEARAHFVATQNVRPASYLYQNAENERFLVLLTDAYFVPPARNRNYLRAKQVKAALSWMTERELTVEVETRPDLYVLAKQKGARMAIGLWNLSADPVLVPTVYFSEAVNVEACVCCTASADGKTVTLGELAPYSVAAIEVTRKGWEKA